MSDMKKLLTILLLLSLALPAWAADGPQMNACPKTQMQRDCLQCHVVGDFRVRETAPDAGLVYPHKSMRVINSVGYFYLTEIDSKGIREFFEYLNLHKIKWAVVEIHSPGGALFDAQRIVSYIQAWQAKGGKVSKTQLTQFGRAMRQLGIQMIPAYSPQARGRSERAFQTHQDRLVKELALHGITNIDEANRYLAKVYMPSFNAEFKKPAHEEGSAFVPWLGGDIDDILCEHFERTVNADNCVSFERMTLQIPANRYRCHYVRVKVQVHRYLDGSLAIFHGPRKLADYNPMGKLKQIKKAA